MWSQCDIELEFDDPNRDYEAGDEVTGQVHITVEKDCQCDQLTVTAQWYTHGRGTPARGREFSQVVAENVEWTAGSSHTYPFCIELPNGPCTYRGQYLNVDWSVEADIDISWSFDPEVEKGLIVQPASTALGTPYRSGNPDSNRHNEATSRSQSAATQSPSAGCLMAIIPPVVGYLVIRFSDVLDIGNDTGELFWTLGWLSVAGFALWLLWTKVLRNNVAQLKTGDIEARVRESHISPGDEVTIEVDIPSGSDVHINAIRSEVRGWEKVTYRRGTDTRTKTHDVYTEEVVIDGSVDRELRDGESASLQATIPIPEDVPYSFHARRNHLYWATTIHVDIAGWPDWATEIPLDVVPAVPDDDNEQRDRSRSGPVELPVDAEAVP